MQDPCLGEFQAELHQNDSFQSSRKINRMLSQSVSNRGAALIRGVAYTSKPGIEEIVYPTNAAGPEGSQMAPGRFGQAIL